MGYHSQVLQLELGVLLKGNSAMPLQLPVHTPFLVALNLNRLPFAPYKLSSCRPDWAVFCLFAFVNSVTNKTGTHS